MTQISLFNKPSVNFGYKSTMKEVATAKHVHCAYGGEELNNSHPATAEHIKPKSKGGASNDGNYLPVCAPHNNERGNMPLYEYLDLHPKAWENIKKAILELRNVETYRFNGPSWAKQVKKAVETEAKEPLRINVLA